LPRALRVTLDAEGIRVLDEGIRVSVTYRSFRAPGKRFGRKRRISTGAVAISTKRLVATAGHIRLVNVALDDPRFRNLDIGVEHPGCLRIAFDPSDFNPNQSGRIECRFFTSKAEHIEKWIDLS